MKFFRDSTRGQIVLMGRKTYDSLGKALPARRNAVISRNGSWSVSDAEVYADFSTALNALKPAALAEGKTVFVIGGAEIYSLSLPFWTRSGSQKSIPISKVTCSFRFIARGFSRRRGLCGPGCASSRIRPRRFIIAFVCINAVDRNNLLVSAS